MKLYPKFLAATVAACFMTAAAFAAEASPTGTWKYSQPGRNGGAATERTLKLDLKDGKLTGTMMGTQGGQFQIPDTEITDATFKDGAVAFSVTLKFGENSFTIKYTGKLEGDKITGSIERPAFGGGGAPQKTDWVAMRAK